MQDIGRVFVWLALHDLIDGAAQISSRSPAGKHFIELPFTFGQGEFVLVIVSHQTPAMQHVGMIGGGE
jgi:hypothetical protein